MKEIVDALEKYTKHDIFYNKEKLAKGEINLLYIIGYSGSGKTTLSRTVKQFPNIEVIEHDTLDYIVSIPHKEMKNQGKIFYTFFKMFEESFDDIGNAEKNHEEEMNKLYDKFNRFILKYSKKHRDKIYIVEGTRSLNSYLDKEFPDIAIIVKNTSLIKSFWRATKRNALYKDAYYKERIKNPFLIIKKFFRMLFLKQRLKYYKDSMTWIKKIKLHIYNYERNRRCS